MSNFSMRIAFLIAFLLMWNASIGQLSGSYTIDQSSSPSTTNFSSITSFLDTLHSGGISSSVSVEFVDSSGPYYERLVFDSVQGLSSVNTLTINGNGVSLADQSLTIRPPIVEFTNTSYTTIKDFKILCSKNALHSTGIKIQHASNYNEIVDCEIISDLGNAPTVNAVEIGEVDFFYSTSSTNSHGNEVRNCVIRGGANAIQIGGDTNVSVNIGNKVIENRIIDFAHKGIALMRGKNDEISGNQLLRLNRPDSIGMQGMHIAYSSGSKIFRNTVFHDQIMTNYDVCDGIYVYRNQNPISQPTLIYNNIIYGFKHVLQTRGILLTQTSNIKLNFNTIYLDQDDNYHVTNGIYYSNFLASGNPVDISNNIVYTSRKGDGSNNSIHFTDTSSNIYCNHNLIYAYAEEDLYDRIFVKWANNEFQNFSDWQNFKGGSYDQNSDSTDPEFIFLSIDSLKPNSVSLNDIGIPVAGITSDFYGQSRDSTPDPGAIEFTPLVDDAAIIDSLYQRHCDSITDVYLKIHNKGTDTLKFVTINWQLGVGSTQSLILNPNLPADSIYVFKIDSVVNTSELVIKSWTSNPNGNVDLNPYNDTLNRLVKKGLSGNFTINSALVSSYTNYTSFTSLAFDLNRFGLCGPVIVDVYPGLGQYKESILLEELEGLDSINTLTIIGHNGAELRTPENSAGQTSLIYLNGTDNVTIDSLSFYLDHEFDARGITLYGQSSYNKILNCYVFTEYLNVTSNNYGVGIYLERIYNDSLGFGIENEIIGNTVIGGSVGILVSRTFGTLPDNTIIDSNNVGDFRSNGISCGGLVSAKIRGNTVHKGSNNYGWGNFYGISISGGAKNLINGNDIYGNSSGNGSTVYGIHIEDGLDTSPINSTLVSNNLIHHLRPGGGYGCFGIYVENTSNCRVYHNSIILPYNYFSGAQSGIKLYQNGTGIEVLNNLVDIHSYYNNNNYCLDYDTSMVYSSNNNLLNMKGLYSNSNSGVGRLHNQVFSDITDWQGALGFDYDSNSVETDLLIRDEPYAPHAPLADDIGKSLGILTDFYGNPRDLNNPDAGAIEFKGDTINVKVDSVDHEIFKKCAKNNLPLKVYLENLGSQNLYNFPVFIEISVNGDTARYSKMVDSLRSYEYKTVNIGNLDTVMTGKMMIRAFTDLAGDQFIEDDTSKYLSDEVYPYPPKVNIDDKTVCIGDTILITPPQDYGLLLWYSSSSSNVPIAVDTALLLKNIKSSKTYFVEGRKYSDDCPGVRQSFKVFIGNTEGSDFEFEDLGSRVYRFIPDVPGKPNSYHWDFGDGNSSTIDQPLHTYSTDGKYNVILTLEGDCDSSVVERTVNVGYLGINEASLSDDILIMPNPFKDRFLVRLPVEFRYGEIQIINSQGQLIKQIEVVNNTQEINFIDASPGVYIIRILSEDKTKIKTGRLIKKAN